MEFDTEDQVFFLCKLSYILSMFQISLLTQGLFGIMYNKCKVFENVWIYAQYLMTRNGILCERLEHACGRNSADCGSPHKSVGSIMRCGRNVPTGKLCELHEKKLKV